MTRYILNSGGLRGKPELSREFFTEIVSGLGSCPRLLLCYFAKPRKEWEKKYSEDKNEIPTLLKLVLESKNKRKTTNMKIKILTIGKKTLNLLIPKLLFTNLISLL